MLSDEELAAIRDHYVATKERDAPHRLGFVDGGFVDSIFDHIVALQAEADAAKRDVERMWKELRAIKAAAQPFLDEISSWSPDFPHPTCILGDHYPPLRVTWGDLFALEAALYPQETPRDASEDGSNQASEE